MSIGVDQWVETADSRRVEPDGWWGRGSRWWGSLPPWGRIGLVLGLAAFVPSFAVRLRRSSRRERTAPRAARRGPERLRRLGGTARPRVHRVLRIRGIRIRDPVLGPARHRPADARRGSARGRRDRSARRRARTAVTTVERRLPRDRDAVLQPDLPGARAQRRPARRRPDWRAERHRRRHTVPSFRHRASAARRRTSISS